MHPPIIVRKSKVVTRQDLNSTQLGANQLYMFEQAKVNKTPTSQAKKLTFKRWPLRPKAIFTIKVCGLYLMYFDQYFVQYLGWFSSLYPIILLDAVKISNKTHYYHFGLWPLDFGLLQPIMA